MKNHNYYVYILTNKNNNVMYVGMTNNLERRLFEHKNKLVEGFTKDCNVHRLVYFEHTTSVEAAISREKEIKKWRREKKNQLVTMKFIGMMTLAISLPFALSLSKGGRYGFLRLCSGQAISSPRTASCLFTYEFLCISQNPEWQDLSDNWKTDFSLRSK